MQEKISDRSQVQQSFVELQRTLKEKGQAVDKLEKAKRELEWHVRQLSTLAEELPALAQSAKEAGHMVQPTKQRHQAARSQHARNTQRTLDDPIETFGPQEQLNRAEQSLCAKLQEPHEGTQLRNRTHEQAPNAAQVRKSVAPEERPTCKSRPAGQQDVELGDIVYGTWPRDDPTDSDMEEDSTPDPASSISVADSTSQTLLDNVAKQLQAIAQASQHAPQG